MRRGAWPVLKELENTAKVVGVKQVRRALANGQVRRVYLAQDADPQLTRPLELQAQELGVETVWTQSMRALGQACGIAVGAAVAAALNSGA